MQCWPHQEDADPAELSMNSIRKRGCYHPRLPAHKPGPHLCQPLHACIILATRGERVKNTGFAGGNHTPVCSPTSFPMKLAPNACSTAGDLYSYLRSSSRRPSGGRHCCRWRACTWDEPSALPATSRRGDGPAPRQGRKGWSSAGSAPAAASKEETKEVIGCCHHF